jgi:integrase
MQKQKTQACSRIRACLGICLNCDLKEDKMTAILYSAENERLKRRYFAYLKGAKRYSDSSVGESAKALHRFETYTKFRDFRKFHIEQASGFKKHLAVEKNKRTGKPLAKATIYGTLSNLRAFFHWLSDQPGCRAKLSHTDAEYFSLSEKDVRIAKAEGERPFPSLEQVQHVLRCMPANSEIEKRDRAVIALTLLTGARDRAIASLKLKHLDLLQHRIMQDARDVKTKFSKSFPTWFFPVGGEASSIAAEWERFLRAEKLFGPEDPLFPKTAVAPGSRLKFEVTGLSREFWSDAAPVRRIFKSAFEGAGLPYYNPHSIRKTLTQLGEQLCGTPEEFKAWSQNLGHEQVMTTFRSYGSVPQSRQAEILRMLSRPRPADDEVRKQLKELVAAWA